MLGVEGYGSDNDSDDEHTQTKQPSPPPAARLTAPQKKSGLSLPPPAAASTSKLSLPTPKKRAPKKIAIGLPGLPDASGRDETLDDQPPAKKARVEPGAGSSSLFSMLPAPKNKNPVPAAAERVLGGGRGPGLVFNAGVKKPAPGQATVEDVEDENEEESTAPNAAPLSSSILEQVAEPQPKKSAAALPFLPPSLAKGKANVSTEDRPTMSKVSAAKAANSAPAVDFFSLGSSSSAPHTRPSASEPSTSSLPSSSITVSSAPAIEDFVPPEPTQTDPYPGYYLLPSGSWAAYDTAYYQKFYVKWKKDYDAHVRALEKGIEKGFEGAEADDTKEVNALSEMERAREEIQVREERKALTTASDEVPAAPKMNIKGAALSGRARTRHQLSTLLTEAYQNREALEEQIAQARRNRKEAGNKYGF